MIFSLILNLPIKRPSVEKTTLKILLTSVLLGISVILLAHTRFWGHLGAPANVFQTLKSCYVRKQK
jgi:hypothetical protein